MSMSYLDDLRVQIRRLEKQIMTDQVKKFELEAELNKLRLAEFEEDIKESRNQQFLKG